MYSRQKHLLQNIKYLQTIFKFFLSGLWFYFYKNVYTKTFFDTEMKTCSCLTCSLLLSDKNLPSPGPAV